MEVLGRLTLSGCSSADRCSCAKSNLEPMVEEKLDFFFLWVLMKDCISKVLLAICELLGISLDLWLFMCLEAVDSERLFLSWEMQQLWVDRMRDSLLSLPSLLLSRGYFTLLRLLMLLDSRWWLGVIVIFRVFSRLFLALFEPDFFTVCPKLHLFLSESLPSWIWSSRSIKSFLSAPLRIPSIIFINVYCYIYQNYSPRHLLYASSRSPLPGGITNFGVAVWHSLIIYRSTIYGYQFRLGAAGDRQRLQIPGVRGGGETQEQQLQGCLAGGLPEDPDGGDQASLQLPHLRTHREVVQRGRQPEASGGEGGRGEGQAGQQCQGQGAEVAEGWQDQQEVRYSRGRG